MPRQPTDLMLGGFRVYEPADLVEARARRAISLATALEPETFIARGLGQNPQSARNRSVSEIRFGPIRLPWYWLTLTLTVRVGLVDL